MKSGMRIKVLCLTICCLVISAFVLSGVGVAEAKSSAIKVRVEAELEPFGAPPPEPDAEGSARHRMVIIEGVMTKNEFKGTVEIPVPSPGLGLDAANVADADIRLILSRTGADFAECRLEFQEIEEEMEMEEGVEALVQEAEFQVDVRMRDGVLQEKKGVCDVDLLTADIQSGVPDAQAGDVATAAHVAADGTRTDFLQGTFMED